MDDVLSAVDSQVAKYLVEFLLFDYLRNKTRILCTHHVQYLQSADWILVFQEGSLVSQGKWLNCSFHTADLLMTLSLVLMVLISH